MASYSGNRNAGNDLAIESRPSSARRILKLLDLHEQWQGTASEVLAALNEHADATIKAQREWPSKGAKVSNALRRLAPNLRAEGVNVTFTRDTDKKRARIILLEKMADKSSEPSEPSANTNSASIAEFPADDMQATPDDPSLFGSSAKNHHNATENALSDDADDADGSDPTQSDIVDTLI